MSAFMSNIHNLIIILFVYDLLFYMFYMLLSPPSGFRRNCNMLANGEFDMDPLTPYR